MNAGVSSMRTGNVVGSLPDGETSPAQHVGERVAPLLAREPRLQDRGDVVGPRHLDRRRRVDHDDGARVRRRDRADELVLRRRQRHRLAVVAFGLPVVVGADDAHDRVGAARERDRAVHQVGRRRRPAPDLETAEPAGRDELDLERVRLARGELDRARAPRALPKPMNASLRPVGLPVVDDHLAVDREPGPADLHERERPLARLGRDHRAAHSQRELVGHAVTDRTDEREQPAAPSPRRSTGSPARSRPAKYSTCSGPCEHRAFERSACA